MSFDLRPYQFRQRLLGLCAGLFLAVAQAAPEIPPPLKVRDAFVVTQAADAKDLKKLAAEFPGRDIIST